MSTLTRPLDQHPTPAAREVGLAVINRVLPTYERMLHDCDRACLEHERDRWESMPASPVATAFRALIDSERIERRLGGRA